MIRGSLRDGIGMGVCGALSGAHLLVECLVRLTGAEELDALLLDGALESVEALGAQTALALGAHTLRQRGQLLLQLCDSAPEAGNECGLVRRLHPHVVVA